VKGRGLDAASGNLNLAATGRKQETTEAGTLIQGTITRENGSIVGAYDVQSKKGGITLGRLGSLYHSKGGPGRFKKCPGSSKTAGEADQARGREVVENNALHRNSSQRRRGICQKNQERWELWGT